MDIKASYWDQEQGAEGEQRTSTEDEVLSLVMF